MNRPAFNPYLPSWEYIPDGEPYVFNDRVYIYGSHDKFNGHAFCLNDYVCWSAPVENLADWRFEGTIYRKTDDPANPHGEMCLYAPDLTVGPDGRFYLYYVLDKAPFVSVAVCDSPAGKYEFLGYVCYPDGSRLGEKEGDEPQFDPGVLTEGNKVWLYTGFSGHGDRSRQGAMLTLLEPDMLSIKEGPRYMIPSESYAKGTGFENHAFFEASSIRKRGDLYYLIYSSTPMHELCYATSNFPDKDFSYGGVIVSNNDIGISSYKPAEKPMYYGGNNHGSIVEIKGEWYVFYHRQTNGTFFCRQGCMEKIRFNEDGSIPQVELTSCGSRDLPLPGKGEYPAYIACNLFCNEESMYTALTAWPDNRFPLITQEGRDGDEEPGYLANMMDTATAGFKYFDCKGVSGISIKVRGYCKGEFQVKTSWDGPTLGSIPVLSSSVWKQYKADIKIPDGVLALYFTYKGSGRASLYSFTLS